MIGKLWTRWTDFWFGPVGLLNLAIFRIVYTGILFFMYASRQMDVGIYYTDQGILPRALSHQILASGFRPPVQFFFWPDSWVFAVHGLFVFCLLMLCLGVWNRVFGLIATYLHLAFLFRNYGVAFGVDQITSFLLLYLSLTQADARLSLRSWWRSKKQRPALEGGEITSMFYRLLQIQLCLIYVYSGMEKLRGQSWWDGTALWSVLANSQMVIADFTWTRHVPFLIVLISFSTILFEIYFPVLVWVPRLRKYCLALGVLFHSGIALVMALWSFAAVMISPYVLFVPEGRLRSFLSHLETKFKKTAFRP